MLDRSGFYSSIALHSLRIPTDFGFSCAGTDRDAALHPEQVSRARLTIERFPILGISRRYRLHPSQSRNRLSTVIFREADHDIGQQPLFCVSSGTKGCPILLENREARIRTQTKIGSIAARRENASDVAV